MSIILQTLFISSLAFAIEQGYIETFTKPQKPFSCAPCMSLWLGVGAALLTANYLLVGLPYLATKILNKYFMS